MLSRADEPRFIRHLLIQAALLPDSMQLTLVIQFAHLLHRLAYSDEDILYTQLPLADVYVPLLTTNNKFLVKGFDDHPLEWVAMSLAYYHSTQATVTRSPFLGTAWCPRELLKASNQVVSWASKES